MLSLSNNYPNLKCHCPICQSHSIALLPGWQVCLTQLHLRQRQLLQGARAWPVCDLIPIYIYYQTHHLSSCVFGQDWNDSDLRLKLCRILNFSIRYTFDSYSTRFNLVRFLTSILNSSTFDFFPMRNSLEERKSCNFMTWYNSNMCILLRMATSDCKNNARFEFHLPKNPCEQLDWQLNTYNTHLYY